MIPSMQCHCSPPFTTSSYSREKCVALIERQQEESRFALLAMKEGQDQIDMNPFRAVRDDQSHNYMGQC